MVESIFDGVKITIQLLAGDWLPTAGWRQRSAVKEFEADQSDGRLDLLSNIKTPSRGASSDGWPGETSRIEH